MGNLQDVMGTRETDRVWWVHGKLTRCDRYIGNLQDVIGTWEIDKVWLIHGKLTKFPLYLSHLVSFPCTDHILYASLVSVTPRQFLMYSSHIIIIFFRFQSWLININILHCNLLLNCVILYKYDMRSCLENYIYLFIIKLICFLFLGKQRRMCKRKCKRGMYTEINITSFLILNLWLVTLQSISNDVPIFLSYKSKTYNRILK
jgi:hypothetical protein